MRNPAKILSTLALGIQCTPEQQALNSIKVSQSFCFAHGPLDNRAFFVMLPMNLETQGDALDSMNFQCFMPILAQVKRSNVK